MLLGSPTLTLKICFFRTVDVICIYSYSHTFFNNSPACFVYERFVFLVFSPFIPLESGGASSPFAGGALVQSRSAKSIKAVVSTSLNRRCFCVAKAWVPKYIFTPERKPSVQLQHVTAMEFANIDASFENVSFHFPLYFPK